MDQVSPFEPTVVGAVARHWRLVLVVIAVLVVPAAAYGVTLPVKYTATASLTVGDPRGLGVLGGQAPEAPDRYVADQLVVFKSAALGDSAARRGREQKPPLTQPATWYLAHVAATATATDNNLIGISFSGSSASEALSGLRATVTAYGDVARASMASQANAVLAQLDSSLNSVDGRLRVLQNAASSTTVTNQIQQLTTSRASLAARRDQVAGEAASPATGVAQALLPSEAIAGGRIGGALRIVVLAFAFGLLLGIALAYARSYRKRVFVDRRDPELLLGAPLLADVSGLRTVDLLGLTPEADAARVEQEAQEVFAIAVSLIADSRANDDSGLSLAVVSATSGATCTAVAWRSALAFATQGLRVLLIDVDGSWPAAGAWLTRVAGHVSWVERADGSFALEDSRPGRRTGRFPAVDRAALTTSTHPALYFCGEPPPVRTHKALRTVFRDLEDDFDVVMVNAPPFLPSADAAHLTSAAGAALVVVPDGGSINDHEELTRRLRLAGATALGYVYCCAGCDVANPPPGSAKRLRRALHVESAGAPLRKVSGLEGTRLTTDRR